MLLFLFSLTVIFSKIYGAVNILSLTPTFTDSYNATSNTINTERYDELTITCFGGDTANLKGIGADGAFYNISVTCNPLSYTYQLTRETYVPNATNVVVNEVCQRSAAPNIFQSSGQNQAQAQEIQNNQNIQTSSFKPRQRLRNGLYEKLKYNHLPKPQDKYYRHTVTFLRSDGAPCSPGLNSDPNDCKPHVKTTSDVDKLHVSDVYYRYSNGTTCDPVTGGLDCQAYSTPISTSDRYVFVNTNNTCSPLTDGPTCVLVGIAAQFGSNFTAPPISTIQNGTCLSYGTNTQCDLVNGVCPSTCFSVPAPIKVNTTVGTVGTLSVPDDCTTASNLLIGAGSTQIVGGIAAAAVAWIPFSQAASYVTAGTQIAVGSQLVAGGVEQGRCYNELENQIQNVALVNSEGLKTALSAINQVVAATNQMLQNVNTFAQVVNQKFAIQDAQNQNFQAQLNTQAAALEQQLQYAVTQNSINQGVQGQMQLISAIQTQVSTSINSINSTLNNFVQSTNDNFATARAFEQVLQSEIIASNQAEQQDIQNIEKQLTRIQVINGVRFAQFVQQVQSTTDLFQQHIQQLYTNFNIEYQIINGVYQSVQQTYSYLFDISASIQRYHSTLTQIENDNEWLPFLLTQGSPLANETQWNIISTRIIQVNTNIGCQSDQTQSTDPLTQSVIDTFYSSYPLSVIQLNQNAQSVSQINGNDCFNYNNNQAQCLNPIRRCTYVTCRYAPANSAQCIPTFGNLSLYNTPFSPTANTNDSQTYTQINGTALFGLSSCTYNPTQISSSGLSILIAQPNPQNSKFLGCFTPQSTTTISSLGTIIAESDTDGPLNATSCITNCYSNQYRYASVTTDANGVNYCLCGYDMPGETLVDVVTQCSANCTAPDNTGRTCGGLQTLSVYRTGREDFIPQSICSFYSTQEDCLTDSRCGYILVKNNQGYCSEQTDSVYTTYCNSGQGLVTCYPSTPGFIYGAYNYQSLSETRYQLASLPSYPLNNDTLLSLNSQTYQDLTNGFYNCPGGLIDIPGNNTHCCLTAVVSSTGACPNAIRNPQNPYDLWFSQVQNNCPANYQAPLLNLTVMIGCSRNASRTQPGSYACVPVVDEGTLSQLGYNISTIGSWNGTIYLNGALTRIKQLVSIVNATTENNNELYTLFGENQPTPDLPPTNQFYDSYDQNMNLFNYTFNRFYGYNLTSYTADGSGQYLDLSTWDRHQTIDSLISDLLAQDISTYQTVMQTFYGDNPLTWGASYGSPVKQTQQAPSYVNNIRTTKCNYASFGIYKPNLIPVWKLADLSAVNYGSACGGYIYVNGVGIKQDSCFVTDIASINRPANGERLIFGTDPSGTYVYSPPNNVIRPDENEAGRRGSVTYVHTYGQPSLDINAFLNANQNFDCDYMSTSIATYSAYMDQSNDQFCGNLSNQIGFGTMQGGLCLLSKQYSIAITNPTNETLPAGATPDGTSLIMRLYSSFAPMQFSLKVPFTQVGLSMQLDGCPSHPIVQCDPSTQLTCSFMYTNPYQYTLQTNFSVVYNNTANITDGTYCVAPTILSAASLQASVFPFENCQGNLTIQVNSIPSGNTCLVQNVAAISVQNFFGNDSATQIKTTTETLSYLQLQFTALTNSLTANNYANIQSYIQSTARVSQTLDVELPYIQPFYDTGVLTTRNGLTLDLQNVSQQLATTSYIVAQFANVSNINATIQALTSSIVSQNATIAQYQSQLVQSLVNYQFTLNSLEQQQLSLQSEQSNYTQYLAKVAAQLAIDAYVVNYTTSIANAAITNFINAPGTLLPVSTLPAWLVFFAIFGGVMSILLAIFVFLLYYLRNRDLKRYYKLEDEEDDNKEEDKKPLVKAYISDYSFKRPQRMGTIPSLIVDE